jgi:hypothetical protein
MLTTKADLGIKETIELGHTFINYVQYAAREVILKGIIIKLQHFPSKLGH